MWSFVNVTIFVSLKEPLNIDEFVDFIFPDFTWYEIWLVMKALILHSHLALKSQAFRSKWKYRMLFYLLLKEVDCHKQEYMSLPYPWFLRLTHRHHRLASHIRHLWVHMLLYNFRIIKKVNIVGIKWNGHELNQLLSKNRLDKLPLEICDRFS